MNKIKKILFKLTAILIGLACGLLFFEVFLRLNPKLGYNYNSYKADSSKEPRLHYFNEDLNRDPRHRGRYRPSSLLGYEHIPNSRPEINSYGLIGREYKLKKDENTFRILLLGDSIAAQGWPAGFLEEELNQNPQLGSKYKFEIWNAGVGAYEVRQYFRYLIHKGLRYKPDLVMIFLFINDFRRDTAVYYKKKDGFTGYYFPLQQLYRRGFIINPFLTEHSYLYRFIILRLNAYLSNKEKTQVIDQEKENGRYYLGRIKEICQKNKINLLVVIFPYLQPLDEYKNFQINQYKNICEVTKELDIEHINLYDLYNQLLREGFNIRKRNDDRIHPSKQAQKLIAHEIYSYMLAKPALFIK